MDYKTQNYLKGQGDVLVFTICNNSSGISKFNFIYRFEQEHYNNEIVSSSISEYISNTKTQGILVLAPFSIPPGLVLPASVIKGVPIGIYYYDTKCNIGEILKYYERIKESKDKRVVILSMWKKFFLESARKFSKIIINQNKYKLISWLADETSRDGLVKNLSTVCFIDIVLYLGHGRSRGWSGYRGVRWHHIKKTIQEKPNVGSVISMTCDNLKFEENKIPFGVKWVKDKKAYSFFGATDCVKIIPMKKICSIIVELLSKGNILTIGELLAKTNKIILNTKDLNLINCWSKFRLIGNPLTQI